MKTAPVDIALQISALNEAVNQRLHLRVGWGEKIESHDMSVWGKTESKAACVMMFFQVRKGRSRLVLFYCSADSDNSKLIRKDPKIGPMYQAALVSWERAIVSTGCQPKHFLRTHLCDCYL